MSLNFCCDIQMAGSEFSVNNMKACSLNHWYKAGFKRIQGKIESSLVPNKVVGECIYLKLCTGTPGLAEINLPR